MIDYWTKVKALAWALKGDGCSKVPDFHYRCCCDEHDIHYRTGMTIDGQRLTRKEADQHFLKCMQNRGGVLLPYIYYFGVRLFGENAWDRDRSFYNDV